MAGILEKLQKEVMPPGRITPLGKDQILSMVDMYGNIMKRLDSIEARLHGLENNQSMRFDNGSEANSKKT